MRIWIALIALVFAPFCYGQSTTVTAQITDSDGQTWNNGTVIASFVPGPVQAYKWPGGAIPNQVKGSMDGTGTFTISLPDNTTIAPAGSAWRFSICPNASAPCVSTQITVSGSSMNLSSQLSAIAAGPRFAAGPGTYGYLDIEVTPIPNPGGSYWNVSDTVGRCWTGGAWNTCSGSGSGTVNAGSTNQAAVYPASGTAVQGSNSLNLSGSITGAGLQDTNRPVVNTSSIAGAGGGSCGSGTDEVSKLCQLSVNADTTGYTGNNIVSAVNANGPCTVTASTQYFFDPATLTVPLTDDYTTAETLPSCQFNLTGELDIPMGGSITGTGTNRENIAPAVGTMMQPAAGFAMNPGSASFPGAIVNFGPQSASTGNLNTLGAVVSQIGIRSVDSNGNAIGNITCLENGAGQQGTIAHDVDLYNCQTGLGLDNFGTANGPQNHYNFTNIGVVPPNPPSTPAMTGMIIENGGSGYDASTSIAVTGCTIDPTFNPVITAGVITGYQAAWPTFFGSGCAPTGTTVTAVDGAGSGAVLTAIVQNTQQPVGVAIAAGQGRFETLSIVSSQHPIVPPYGVTVDTNSNYLTDVYCESIDTCFAEGTLGGSQYWGNIVWGLRPNPANNPCYTGALLGSASTGIMLGGIQGNGCPWWLVDKGHNGGSIGYNGWSNGLMFYARDHDQIISSNPAIETDIPIGVSYHDCASSGCGGNSKPYAFVPVINVNGYAQSFGTSNTADPIGIASNGDLSEIGTDTSTIHRVGLISCIVGTSGTVTPGDYVVQGTTVVEDTQVVSCADSGSSSPPTSGTTWGKWVNDGANGSDSVPSTPSTGSITSSPTGSSSYTYEIVHATLVDQSLSVPYSISTTTGPLYLSHTSYNELTSLTAEPLRVYRTSVPYSAPTVTANCDTTSGKAVSLTVTGGNALFPPTVTFSGGGFTSEPTATLTVASGSTWGYTFNSQGVGCTSNATGTVTESKFDTGYIGNSASATTFIDNGRKGDNTTPPASGQLAPRLDFYLQHWTGAALTNPMTTTGDMIVGGASGAPARLAAGSNGQVLEMVSGTPAWTSGQYSRTAGGYCAGTLPSNLTSGSPGGVYLLGDTSTGCTAAGVSRFATLIGVMPAAGTVSNLSVQCGTAGVGSTSGTFVITDFPAGGGAKIVTPVTVTMGTTAALTLVQDTTDTYSYSAGDALTVLITSTASSGETLANCDVQFEY